jgi:hypothetical protein
VVLDLDDKWANIRLPVHRFVKTTKGIHDYCLVKELPKNSSLLIIRNRKLVIYWV